MNKYLTFLILFAIALCPAYSQNKKHENKEKMWQEMQEFKMKFLAQEIDLKEDQQKQFFEVYSQMSAEKAKVFKETKQLEKKLKNEKNVSDAEYAEVSKAITAAKEKDAAIEKKYDEKFATFLSPKQVYKLKAAEEKFHHKMRELRNKNKKKK